MNMATISELVNLISAALFALWHNHLCWILPRNYLHCYAYVKGLCFKYCREESLD